MMQNRTRCKICGITNLEDAQTAIEAGADALGFVFYQPSPRYIAPDLAAEIIAKLPPFVSTVGLFVNHSSEAVDAILQQLPLDLAQFHGEESPKFCRQFKMPYVKALGVTEKTDLEQAFEDYSDARALLLDAFDPKLKGGTGKTFNWNLVTGSFSLPIILAGGLTPRNVGSAIEQVNPYAVDVSGGVEQSKGKKDPLLVRAFLSEVYRERKINS